MSTRTVVLLMLLCRRPRGWHEQDAAGFDLVATIASADELTAERALWFKPQKESAHAKH
jgi:hypothetical protein